MQCTTHSDRYYTPREAEGGYDGYWGRIVDPDGNERIRGSESERLLYLESIHDELTWCLGLQPGTVADVGAGLGWFLEELPEAWRKMAVEICDTALERLLAHRGWAVLDSVEKLPSDYCDLIFCHHVIEHVEMPEDFIADIVRATKCGGRIVISTPDFASPCAKRFGDRYRMLHDKTHCSLFTNESMHRLLRDTGLEILDVQFPFPERYATAETMARWREARDSVRVSPPWPGNWMTFYCEKPGF